MSRHEDCRAAVASEVRALGLPGLDARRVYEELVAWETNVTYPCVLVTTRGFPEKVKESTEFFDSEHTLTKIPVGLAVLHRGDARDRKKDGDYLGWRDALLHAWAEWVPPLPEGFQAKAEAGEVVLENAPAELVIAGSLYVWCWLILER